MIISGVKANRIVTVENLTSYYDYIEYAKAEKYESSDNLFGRIP
jgi:hypothetical protein